ncbi:MAG: iron-containing alcohol dehydrogenase, partial [Bacteroidales bacterium]|nr:iron-containing alcohol dehydrogenase [Bacteroidales bacterium]
MINSFKFIHTPDVVFGCGAVKKLAQYCLSFGENILLVHGRSFESRKQGETILNELHKNTNRLYKYCIETEPSPVNVDGAVELYSNQSVDVVVAIGGGSVIDAGKAISAMLATRGSVKDYLEGVGTKVPNGEKIPFIAVPTTAGTGSETTKNAVITQLGENGFKKSLRHDNYVPNLAIVDPELTVSCSPDITAASGMDALSQLLESYLSTTASPMTDALALQGILMILQSIEQAYEDGNNLEARSNLSYAAMLSGITLANAGLGV